MVRNDSNDDGAFIMNAITIFGGCDVGFHTNPETEKRPCFVEINGEKLVCVAQGGECRYNYNYYSPGLSDRKSWTTPIIDESCPNRCCYKVIVCDNHDEKCEGSITYYPHYNKFRGQFARYCRNFDKFGIKDGMRITSPRKDREDVNMTDVKKGMRVIKKKGKNGDTVTRESYY